MLDSHRNKETIAHVNPIIGTWKIVSATLIEKGDTAATDFTIDISTIKAINDIHLAFLKHNLKQGKDFTATFSSGSGRYSLTDNLYKEQLEYCNVRDWKRNDFEFTVTIRNDTLVQSGVKKVAAAGLERLNIEKYLRVKK